MPTWLDPEADPRKIIRKRKTPVLRNVSKRPNIVIGIACVRVWVFEGVRVVILQNELEMQ